MARHNRDARGSDQRGFDYEISYQPDWLRLIKVTRTLESGRQSTKTLFRNSGPREQSPGLTVRTRITSAEQQLDIEVDVNDPHGVVKRIIVVTAPSGGATIDEVEFTLENRTGVPYVLKPEA
ncbi:MAG: hypothetical protein ACT4O1_01480 [Gemmatimonadota bacterium]